MSTIKPGRERSAGEIVRYLRDLQGLARAGLLMSARDTFLIGDAADLIDKMERRIEDLEERIDILAAEMPDAGDDVIWPPRP